MNTLEATFRIVTPMFLGGADQSPGDGIRPPSVKGALRFWWRALNWGRMRKQASCDEAALMLLHDEEARLFGLAAKSVDGVQVGGQGVFLLEVAKQPSIAALSLVADWPVNNTGAGYMAYGILPSKGGKSGTPQLHREGIKESQDFTMRLRFRPQTSQEDRDALLAAMDAWSLCGGLGSRARRGMGSVTRFLDQGRLFTQQEYEQQVKKVTDALTSCALPPYTAISGASVFRILSEGRDARSVLEKAGQEYKDFRGQASNLRGRDKIPFGLPLQAVDEEHRRASPLLFHVHALANDRFVAAALYLPSSLFHPSCPSLDVAEVARFIQGGNP